MNDQLRCSDNVTLGRAAPYNIIVPANVQPAWLHPDQPASVDTNSSHVNSVIAVGGTTWANLYVLATTQFSSATDPLPVIQASTTSEFSLMMVFRNGNPGSEGLTSYRTTAINPNFGNWSAVQVPGTGPNNFWPSLAGMFNYWGSSSNFGVAYASTDGEVYFDGQNWSAATHVSSSA